MATAAESEPTVPPENRAKPPFLRRVRIRNYKSIAFCDVTLEPLTVLVGRNGSGKSNFLDALAFVRDVLTTNLPEAARRHGGWDGVRCRSAADGQITFELGLAATPRVPGADPGPEGVYGFDLAPTIGGAVFGREWFRAGGVGGRVSFDRRGRIKSGGIAVEYNWNFDHPQVPCDRVPNPHPIQSWLTAFAEQPFADLVAGLRLTGFHNFNIPKLRQPQKYIPGSLLVDDGENLAGVIGSVRALDPETVERAGQFLSVIVPEVERFDSVPVGGYDALRFAVSQGEGRTVDFDAASMSDGTLRALAALMAVYQVHQPAGPSLVGIEEPETALHPAAANALVGALDEAALRTQVIVTTHSADLLDHPAIRSENVRVARMVDGRTVIGRVDEASVEIVKDGLNTLGGLERGDTLDVDADDLDRQLELSRNGSGPHG